MRKKLLAILSLLLLSFVPLCAEAADASAQEQASASATGGTAASEEEAEPAKLTRKEKKALEKQAEAEEKALLASMTSEERKEYKKQKAIEEQAAWDAAPFHFDFTLDSGIAFVRGSDVAPFGGFSWGVEAHVYGARIYALAEIMTQPGGSDNGGNAVGEFMAEGGMRLSWKLFGDQNTISHFAIDVGFYAQHVQIPAVSNTYYRMHNGFIIRPAISTTVFRHKLWQTEIGVGYQKTLFPAYDDYDGIVVFIRLF